MTAQPVALSAAEVRAERIHFRSVGDAADADLSGLRDLGRQSLHVHGCCLDNFQPVGSRLSPCQHHRWEAREVDVAEEVRQ